MDLQATDIPSAESSGAAYVAGNCAPLMNEVTAFDLEMQNFGGEPNAAIRLPVRVPFTLHGGWARDQNTAPPVS
jgi:hypothetical protein